MKCRVLLPLLTVAVLTGGCEKQLLSVSPTEALAQEGPVPHDRARLPGGRNPVGRLLEQSGALGLTSEQVTRLATLASELRTRNDALREQLRARLGDRARLTDEQRKAMRARREAARSEHPPLTDEQREAIRARREAVRPLMEEAARSQRAAMEEVRDILTDEQEAKLRELRSSSREGTREGRRGTRRPRGR